MRVVRTREQLAGAITQLKDAGHSDEYIASFLGIDKEVLNVDPNYFTKLMNFGGAVINHTLNGSPTVDIKTRQERLAVCQGCELFQPNNEAGTSGICRHNSCGCNIQDNNDYLNKIAWADQECPLKKWLAVKGKQV